MSEPSTPYVAGKVVRREIARINNSDPVLRVDRGEA
jgi:hypothetical protein